MSSDINTTIDRPQNFEYAVQLLDVSKCFRIYDKPHHRLLQGLMRNRKLYYKEFWALQNSTFEIVKGQTVGIIGKNGAGKSTLLQILTGTLSPTSGDVRINGRVTALLELGAGFNPEFSGIENIYMNGAILGLSRKYIDGKLSEIIAFADIGDFINQPVKIYSSGMYVRLAFAIQANLDPDIFVIDEALAVGDASFVHKCMQRFKQLKESGTTILLVTHDATAVRTLCDRAIWLDKGRIVMDGNPEQVVDEYLATTSGMQLAVSPADIKIGVDADLSSDAIQSDTADGLSAAQLRYGDQSCSFTKINLHDKNNKRADVVSNDSEIKLSLDFVNNSSRESQALIIGYTLRNYRGVDIASNNSEIEAVSITAPEIGAVKTVDVYIELPLLHPGSYAFTVSINYRDLEGNMKNADALPNIVVFEIVSCKQIHVLMSLKSKFIIKNGIYN